MTADHQCDGHPIDIVDELEQCDTNLSRRAARYIRIKRRTLEDTERELRRLCRKLLQDEAT